MSASAPSLLDLDPQAISPHLLGVLHPSMNGTDILARRILILIYIRVNSRETG